MIKAFWYLLKLLNMVKKFSFVLQRENYVRRRVRREEEIEK